MCMQWFYPSHVVMLVAGVVFHHVTFYHAGLILPFLTWPPLCQDVLECGGVFKSSLTVYFFMSS